MLLNLTCPFYKLLIHMITLIILSCIPPWWVTPAWSSLSVLWHLLPGLLKKSPNLEDLNISTLPCIHHTLPERALYKIGKHMDDSLSQKSARVIGHKTKIQHSTAWYCYFVYPNFNLPSINSQIIIFQANEFTYSNLDGLHSCSLFINCCLPFSDKW